MIKYHTIDSNIFKDIFELYFVKNVIEFWISTNKITKSYWIQNILDWILQVKETKVFIPNSLVNVKSRVLEDQLKINSFSSTFVYLSNIFLNKRKSFLS